jgi:hypothetical protein
MSHGSIVAAGLSLRKAAMENQKTLNLKVAATFTIKPAIKHCNDVILSDASSSVDPPRRKESCLFMLIRDPSLRSG